MFSFFGKHNEISVYAPVDGEVKSIIDVPDVVFSSKMIGDGIAIDNISGDIYAPVDGIIKTVIKSSNHAFGIVGDCGIELLVHVGLETVNLKKGGFKLVKDVGDKVKAGEKIIEVDYKYLETQQNLLITPIVITNNDQFIIKKQLERGTSVKAGKTVIMDCNKQRK